MKLAFQLGIETDSLSRLDQFSKLFNCSMASFFLEASNDSNIIQPFFYSFRIEKVVPR
jgi:hypothetical protein